MFGQNPVRKQELGDGGSLLIKEVFHTIQGEGPSSGRPAVFVRLGGCNLRCHFCDTDFESDLQTIKLLELTNLVSAESQRFSDTRLVVLTGGEPFRQNIVHFIHTLLNRGFEVEIETAGTLWIDTFPTTSKKVRVICSPKTSKVVLPIQNLAAAWKYIIIDGEQDVRDGLPRFSTQSSSPKPQFLARPPVQFPNDRIYVQPCDVPQNPEASSLNLRQAVRISLTYGYRLSLQVHKLVNLP